MWLLILKMNTKKFDKDFYIERGFKMDDLFGKYCYIDTPWIAGKRTKYRILTSFLSNTWANIPISNEEENMHDYQEKVAVVCLDTLVSTESKFFRVKVSDIEII